MKKSRQLTNEWPATVTNLMGDFIKDRSMLDNAVKQHSIRLNGINIHTLFSTDPSRKNSYSVELNHIKLDYSRQRIDNAVINDLIRYAKAKKLEQSIHALFNGQEVNKTESRAAFHTAFRTILSNHSYIAGIETMQAKMAGIVNSFHTRQWLGATGMPITNIVHIGIGGSYWGPQCLLDALADLPSLMSVYCIAELDSCAINDLLETLDPTRTAFIIASKSFTTFETIENAKRAVSWLTPRIGPSIKQHLIAITENIHAAIEFGVDSNHILPMWDWVGGRYSIWSSISLPVCLRYGMKSYWDLLSGAKEIDEHFLAAEWSQNMPMLMALISYWNTQFLHMPAEVILPYPYRLRSIIPHLQQVCMESLGKGCTQDGQPLTQITGPMVWGSLGSQAQHTFNQWLQQSPMIVPVDFMLPTYDIPLLTQGLAQSEALAFGDSHENQHAKLSGNRPHNMLFISEISAKTMGMLLALYEHKVFCFAMLLNINPFDQFGVEYSKKVARDLLRDIP